MTDQNVSGVDTLVTIFKVAQIPLIPIIAFMCFRAVNVIKRKELSWIGVAFIFNFCYLICKILQDTTLNIHFEIDFFQGIGRIQKILDFFTFCCFDAAILKWLYDLQFSRSKIFNFFNSLQQEIFTRRKIYFTLFLLVTLIILALLIFLPYSGLTTWIVVIFDFLSLTGIAICFVKWSDKYYGKYQLYLGFQIWAITQLFNLARPWINSSEIEAAGFIISLVCKVAILFGILFFYLEFAVSTERELSELRINKETAAKSSKYFQDILRRTFHEIIIPMKSLGKSIDKLAEYKLSKFNNEYFELDCNYERVKTIISVSINSYNAIDQFSDEFLEVLPVDDKSRIVNLNNLIEIAMRQIKNSYKGIQFMPLYSKGCYVECTQSQIVQVFTNLFKNAIEAYSPEDKKIIVVRCYSTKARQHPPDERHVVVEIEDNGIGIPQENIEKIWEIDFSTKEVDDKNVVRGQGLALVREILGNHPTASIEVESPIKVKEGAYTKLQRGTRFKITFIKKFLPNEKLDYINNDN